MTTDLFPATTDPEWWRSHGNPEDFPVGSRVETKRCGVDFRSFNEGHVGTVVQNHMRYLGIIVEFDKPIRWFVEDGEGLKSYNFHPENLTLIRHGKRRGDSVPPSKGA